MDLSRFTAKLGPLPIYAWALIIVGGALVLYRFVGGTPSVPTGTIPNPNTDGQDSVGDYATADSSAGIGLASGNGQPVHVIVDNPNPNLYSPAPTTPNVPAPAPRPPKPSGQAPRGTVWTWSVAGKKWYAAPVPRPTTPLKKGYVWEWSYNGGKWYQKPANAKVG